MSWIKRELPLGIVFIVGFVILADYGIQVPVLQATSKSLLSWTVIIAAFAFGIGGLNLIKRGILKISKRDEHWPYIVVQFVFLILTMGIGLGWGVDHPWYKILFNNMVAPLNITMASMLVFFVASAAFRVMRIRNIETTLLLVSALFVMLANAPVGVLIWSGFAPIGKWLLTVPGIAGNRGIIIGSAVASVGFAFRLLLGYERRWLGRSDE